MTVAPKRVSHDYTSEMVCPFCDHVLSDSWEITLDGDCGEVECPECEKKFYVERDHDVTYSTCVPAVKKPPPVPVANMDFLGGAPAAEPRAGELCITGTKVEAKEDAASRDLPAHENVLQGALAHLHARGFALDLDPHTVKHYPTIAHMHWIGRRGPLEVHINAGFSFEAEFYEPVSADGKRGGRFGSDKFWQMSRTLQLTVIAELATVVKRLLLHGYRLANSLARAPLLLAVRDAVVDRHVPRTAAESLRNWSASYRDEQGHILEKEYLRGGGGVDRDKVRVRSGDVRYFYNYSGHLMRGRVYPSLNQNIVAEAGGAVFSLAQHKFFLSDAPDTLPRRSVPQQAERLHRELEKALKREDYPRVATLARVLTRLTAVP